MTKKEKIALAKKLLKKNKYTDEEIIKILQFAFDWYSGDE
jgi:hypothetical protein